MRPDPLDNVQIMLFDPDRNSASVTKLAMQQAGINLAKHAKEEAEALESHEASPFQIILVEMTDEFCELGAAFIRALRSLPKEQEPPPKVATLLGHGTEEALRTSIAVGADSAWVKPLSAIKLRKQLEHLLAATVPYYQAEEYFGPDRRRVPDDHEYDGTERRTD
ncbi:response regulator [Aestuariispira insulae]|uniref:CheY-like chemotaxis protein n=1 Tax=Aestuariispira insulae TaxID=1461337 RepID=A0A3D9HE24_9PROT|nr:response regulator [Aestuariispira insulae]RED47738.1 CheY-like chemotaxis protein [Aestuariispira insulae]